MKIFSLKLMEPEYQDDLYKKLLQTNSVALLRKSSKAGGITTT